MNEDRVKHLIELCEPLDNGYGWFMDWLKHIIRDYGTDERIEEMIQVIENDPKITSDDVMEIPRKYPERPSIVIVDDDEI
jgi:hypothetical protein